MQGQSRLEPADGAPKLSCLPRAPLRVAVTAQGYTALLSQLPSGREVAARPWEGRWELQGICLLAVCSAARAGMQEVHVPAWWGCQGERVSPWKADSRGMSKAVL